MVISHIPSIDEEKEAFNKLRQEARLEHLKNVREAAKEFSLERVREFQKVKELKMQQLTIKQQKKEQVEEEIQQKRATALVKERIGEAFRCADALREREEFQAQHKLEVSLNRKQKTEARCLRALYLERLARTLKSETDMDFVRQRNLANPTVTKPPARVRPLLPPSLSIPSTNITKCKEYYEDTRFHTVRNQQSHPSAMARAQAYTLEQDQLAQKQLEKTSELQQRAELRGQHAMEAVWMEKNKTKFMNALSWVHTKDKERRKWHLHSHAAKDHVFPEEDLKKKFESLLSESPTTTKRTLSNSKLELSPKGKKKGELEKIRKSRLQVPKTRTNENTVVEEKFPQGGLAEIPQVSNVHVASLINKSSPSPSPSQTHHVPVLPLPLQPTQVVPPSTSDPHPAFSVSEPPPNTTAPASALVQQEPSLAELSNTSVSMFTNLSAPSVRLSRLSSSSCNVSLEPETPTLSTMQTSSYEQAIDHVSSVVEDLKSEFGSCLSLLQEDARLFGLRDPCFSLQKDGQSGLHHSSPTSFINLV